VPKASPTKITVCQSLRPPRISRATHSAWTTPSGMSAPDPRRSILLDCVTTPIAMPALVAPATTPAVA